MALFDVSNNEHIMLSRGDTLSFALFINSGNELYPEQYIMTENDTIYFAIMEIGTKFEDAIFKKVFDYNSEKDIYGNLIITLVPQDTENLVSGKYYYTIKMRTIVQDEDSIVRTLIPNREFVIID